MCRTLPDFNWHARVARSLSDSWASCCAKLLTDRQTNNDDYTSSLAELMSIYASGWSVAVSTSRFHCTLVLLEHAAMQDVYKPMLDGLGSQWNSLPPALSLNTFRQKLKTHFFWQRLTSFGDMWRFCDFGAVTQVPRLAYLLKVLITALGIVKGQIPLRSPGRRQVRGWSQTCSERAGIWPITSSELTRASRSATDLRPASDLSATRIA